METPAKSFFKLSETVTCPTCKQHVTLYDASRSEYAVCTSCFSYLHIISSELVRFNQTLKKTAHVPVIKPGAVATFHGIDYKVIAYLEKKEAGNDYAWREYILTSLNNGYLTISEFDGHWNLIGGQHFIPELENIISYGTSVGFKDVEYKLFNRYSPEVTAMIGELDWNIIEEKVKATEYIAPPFMIVKEVTGRTNLLTDYYLGEYLEPKEIAQAFGIDQTLLPNQTGIGANQPSKAYDRWMASLNISIIAILVILGLHFCFSIFKPKQELINDNFFIVADPKNGTDSYKSFVTPSFNLNAQSNIEFEIIANVDNNWFETTIVLVNESDNRTWEVSKGIEYYHGYEDGENWTEGSTNESILLSAIPKGKYHLNVYPSSGDMYRNNLYIKAVANVDMWRNTIWAIIAFCIYPAICWYLMRNFEKRRWNNSDFSPFVND